ncbi:OmpA family protein [bacterium]|nr:OmpA family protein [bacterium]
MQVFQTHAFFWGFIGCIFLWGGQGVSSADISSNTNISDSLTVQNSLKVLESYEDTLKSVQMPADTTASLSAGNTEMIRSGYSYSTNWSWLAMGEISFADSVLLYDPGAPGIGTGDEPDSVFQNSRYCLGPPDHKDSTNGFLSLGSGGTLILEFTDNVFFDNSGPDLYFWIPDTVPEEAQVWISQDGIVYQKAGTVSSESPFLDISGIVKPGEFYTILKIRDNSLQGRRAWPSSGTDIDAVAAIHTAIVEVLPVKALFDPMQTMLKTEASDYLTPVADLIRGYPGGQVLIEVYTDNVGTQDYNLLLSQRWAKEIRDFYFRDANIRNVRYIPVGVGNSRQFIDPHRRYNNSGGMVMIIIFKG